MISNLMMSIKNTSDIDEDLIRHMVLNSIRLLNVKFGNDYGEIVVCCDSGRFWRRDEFQYYKASRKKNRDKSVLDWKKIFGILDTVKREIKENFHYRVVEVDLAEADDIIAVLAAKDSIEHINNNNKVLVVSGDKDFTQLLKYPNVEQWDPVNKKKITHNNPYRFLKEHILRGDVGDGVPNFLSPGNSLVMGIRQKPVTKRVLDKCMSEEDPKVFCETPEIYENYRRNEKLINLDNVPDVLRSEILTEFEREAGKRKSKMLKYFMDKKLSNLFAHVNDF